MKNKLRIVSVFAAVALAATAFISTPQPVHAADSDSGSQLSTLNLGFAPLPFLGQIAPVDAPAPAAAPVTPWYLSTEFFAAIFSVVAGSVAIWQNKQKTTAEKVSASLVVAIEAASKIPEVAAYEKDIKAKLNEKLKKSGAQPIVERLLRDVT